MNIHPLFVHFPIGMLVAYSILSIAAAIIPTLKRQTWVAPVSHFLIFTGVLAAGAAIVTGGMAEELIEDVNPRAYIIGLHETFALATTLAYLILGASLFVRVFDQKGWGDRIVGSRAFLMRIWALKKHLAHLVLDTWLAPLLALIGLILITITGALGAAIVYGPNIDPTASLIYHLFWVQ